MHDQANNNLLPDNAYKELKPGEEYIPVLKGPKPFPEVTPWSVLWGIVMAIIFTAATAYSGLKIGQVFEAAIAIAIIAVGASRFFKLPNALGQNVIIQSIGASSGVIVAGAIFTLPALFILHLQVDFLQIFFSSLFGGFLGILFLIPFRKYFVKDMHGKFPFPEATATTEILMSGEKGGASAGVLIISALIGGAYDLMFAFFRFWEEIFTTKVFAFGAALADKQKLIFQLNVSSMIFGFGYLIGLRYSLIIVVGSLLSWFVLVPLFNIAGGVVSSAGGVNPFAAMPPDVIFRDFVRNIGIGAIAMAGIIGIIKSSKVIGDAFKLAVKGRSKDGLGETVPRNQKDIRMGIIITFIVLTLIAVFIFFLAGIEITLGYALIALLVVLVITFLFTTVAANAIAIVGTNPVSGMTLMTLILSSFVLAKVGLTGEQGMVAALIIGGIVCTALSMAGGFITDLKIGYWIGSTPMKQESWKFLGTLISAATVGVVIFLLNEAYGFTLTPATPNPMEAPQANAMVAVIQPLFMNPEKFNFMLFFVGAVIAILINWLGISPLAFALGMYLPLHLNTPLVIGGLLAYFIQNKTKDPALAKARHQRGTLIASGYIAGAALFGVLGALLTYLNLEFGWDWTFIKNGVDYWYNLEGKAGNSGALSFLNSILGHNAPEIIAIIMFGVLFWFTLWQIKKAKVEEQ